jgi:hypothetical protein
LTSRDPKSKLGASSRHFGVADVVDMLLRNVVASARATDIHGTRNNSRERIALVQWNQ